MRRTCHAAYSVSCFTRSVDSSDLHQHPYAARRVGEWVGEHTPRPLLILKPVLAFSSLNRFIMNIYSNIYSCGDRIIVLAAHDTAREVGI